MFVCKYSHLYQGINFGEQQETGEQVLFSVPEAKPSQIIVLWTVGIWPPNAIQKSLLAAEAPGAGTFNTLEKRLKHPRES